MSAPATHCGLHHCSSDQCPPMDPDLGELLPDLLARGVQIRLVQTPVVMDRCEDCIADTVHQRVADAVAWVCFRAPSEALPEGYVYRDLTCAEHLWAAVTWQLRRGSQCWIEIPHDFRPVTP